MLGDGFAARGWGRIGPAPDIRAWAEAALKDARRAVSAPENAHWLQCEGTWFVGVDVLGNDASGDLPQVPFPASLRRALASLPRAKPFHRAQVSVVYPGYPQPRAGESPAAFRYRRDRDAAHVDGLLPIGPDRRRMLREPHAYILGIALTQCTAAAAPMVVWEGSHLVMQRAFSEALGPQEDALWPATDLTEVYQAARRRVFETCRRVRVVAQPGEAYVVHRLALHGVAPWTEAAEAPPDGRMIAYLRPELQSMSDWPKSER